MPSIEAARRSTALRTLGCYGLKCAQLNGMLTCSENTVTTVKAGLASQRLSRVDEQVCGDTEAVAHLKVIAPLTSTGPSVRARVVRDSIGAIIIRLPHIVFAGALVQIRIANKVLFGKARRCTAAGSEYEIEIEKQEIY